MARNKVSKALTIEREMKAWSLRLQGATYERIANEIGITIAGVSKILARVHKQYYQLHIRSVEQIKIEQISELNNIAYEAYQSWEISKDKSNFCGDPRYLNVFMKAKEDIRKITGYDAILKISNL